MYTQCKAKDDTVITGLQSIELCTDHRVLCRDHRVLCTQTSADAKVRLSGYGVELAIKSTEYKAKDDTVITGIMLSYYNVYSLQMFVLVRCL